MPLPMTGCFWTRLTFPGIWPPDLYAIAEVALERGSLEKRSSHPVREGFRCDRTLPSERFTKRILGACEGRGEVTRYSQCLNVLPLGRLCISRTGAARRPGSFSGSSVARPKLLQEVSRHNEVACLEALGKSVEDRDEKFERFATLGSTSPESREADADTQL